jgi:D-serine deaminase-like pyridoxal phosphate-dependent protein
MTENPETPSYATIIGSEQPYRLAGIEHVVTPALIVYLDRVDANLDATIAIAGNDPGRLRPHVKTAKLARVIHRFVERGIYQCKCATTLEFATACQAGMRDVMVAYPMVGANAQRIRELSACYPHVELSVLVDDRKHLEHWELPTGIFLDVNPGMDRTGVNPEDVRNAVALVRSIAASGHRFRGLHYYEGHLGTVPFEERRLLAARGYERLAQLAEAVEDAGFRVGEVITSGTFVSMFAYSFPAFAQARFVHRVSPGAAVYGDLNTLEHLPAHYGYRPAALVATRVVSHPRPDLFTCDAGLKAVAGFAGLPNCAVLGRPDLVPQRMSEEHLTLQAPPGAGLPEIGSVLYLVPRHGGLTVNNFTEALVVSAGGEITVEKVTARGHESPMIRVSVSKCN